MKKLEFIKILNIFFVAIIFFTPVSIYPTPFTIIIMCSLRFLDHPNHSESNKIFIFACIKARTPAHAIPKNDALQLQGFFA